MDQDVRLAIGEGAVDAVDGAEVVVGAAGDEDVFREGAALFEFLDDVAAEEAAAAGHEDASGCPEGRVVGHRVGSGREWNLVALRGDCERSFDRLRRAARMTDSLWGICVECASHGDSSTSSVALRG